CLRLPCGLVVRVLPRQNNLARKLNGEGRSFPRFALDQNVATHHLTKMAADGKAESGSTILTRNRAVSLNKRRKQLGRLFRSHTNASIAHAKINSIAGGTPPSLH